MYDWMQRTDFRVRVSCETALSAKMIIERVSNGNRAGLLVQDYVENMSWHSFTSNERWIMEKTIRAYRRELIRAGFIDPEHKEILE